MDYSSEEKQATWFNGDDIKSFKNEIKASAALMVSGVSESAEFCAWGLKARTRDGALKKRNNKINGRSIVFLEQNYQQEEGIFEEEAIADAYFDCTEYCQVAGNMLGLRDEVAARAATSTATTLAIVVVVEEKPTTFEALPGLGYSLNRVVVNVPGPETIYPSAAWFRRFHFFYCKE